MRFQYLLYPEALRKLKESGIEARVETLKNSEDGLPYIGGHFFEDEIVGSVQDLKKRGFYDHLPKDFEKKYKTTMNGILKKPEDFAWAIQRPNGTLTEPCDLEDLLLFSGDIASMVMKPEEIWDYQRFGFSSPSELVAVVGAFIKQRSHGLDSFREGYKWTRKRDDGSEIITEVTGDSNADLRIFQTDIAPYPTTDPFGNPIGMRPEMDADRHFVSADHSTEGTLLTAVMKYIEQAGIKATYQEDDAGNLIEWGRSLGQGGGTCAEHFGGFDQNPSMFFLGYDRPIPRLDEANKTDEPSNFGLTTTSHGSYLLYIAHNGDLVLSYQDQESIKNPVKSINIRFLPDDAEHLVKGLIYQSAKGLGRTSANQLFDILSYRYSPKFVEDQKRFK